MTEACPTEPAVPPYEADDDLLREPLGGGETRWRVGRPRAVAVVLGRSSRAALEVDLAACAAAGVPVLRRRGGGAAVLLDPGNVLVAGIRALPRRPDVRALLRDFTAALCAALARADVPGLVLAGISDLALADRKVAGTCLACTQGRALFSATLLVESDPTALSRYLRHPPREPPYRSGRPHADFVRRLADAFPGLTAAGLERRLAEVFDADTLRFPRP